MAGGSSEKIASENLWCAKISNVCLWVKHFWEAISDEIIFESFKTCNISLDLDESESDLEISDYDSDHSINSDNIDNDSISDGDISDGSDK